MKSKCPEMIECYLHTGNMQYTPSMENPKTISHFEWPVEITRSGKRKKTVSAELMNGRLLVRAPARMSDEELAPIIEKLQARLKKRVRPIPHTDESLEKAARNLNKRFFNGRLQWHSIRYVTNQKKRFGSCTPAAGTIRISDRVATLPDWVRDYVVMHELAHLEQANHGPLFWKLVNRYPRTERARGYLMALGMDKDSYQD